MRPVAGGFARTALMSSSRRIVGSFRPPPTPPHSRRLEEPVAVASFMAVEALLVEDPVVIVDFVVVDVLLVDVPIMVVAGAAAARDAPTPASRRRLLPRS
jgi:hypothetical protein